MANGLRCIDFRACLKLDQQVGRSGRHKRVDRRDVGLVERSQQSLVDIL